MSILDKLTEGVSVSIIGMGIVFGVLILLWGVLELMKIIFNPTAKQEMTLEKVIVPTAISNVELDEDQDVLIAVISAAIAASLGTSDNKLKIASIKRIENISPAWNRVGRLNY